MTRLRQWFSNLQARSVAVTLAVLAAITALAGAATIAFGLYNVSARRGHFNVVEWALGATLKNAVQLRADAPPPEDLDSAAMVHLGAAHFERACTACHGRPGRPQPATIRRMEPAPPPVAELAARWDPSELHWIIHQGIKMTGMPAWPAQRADDVWPVVAFLRSAATLDAVAYDRIAKPGDCATCHGENGVSTNPHVPRLDILTPNYVALSLRAYRDGARDSAIMAEVASTLNDDAIAELATQFSRRRPAVAPVAPDPHPDPDLLARGEALASAGTASVPSCHACHGPWPQPLPQIYPALSGQNAAYLAQQLRLWRDGDRGGGAAARLMQQAVRDLGPGQIDALAAWYAAQPPQAPAAAPHR